jgi:hypothetical protein
VWAFTVRVYDSGNVTTGARHRGERETERGRHEAGSALEDGKFVSSRQKV